MNPSSLNELLDKPINGLLKTQIIQDDGAQLGGDATHRCNRSIQLLTHFLNPFVGWHPSIFNAIAQPRKLQLQAR